MPDRIKSAAIIFPMPMCSSNTSHDVIKPETGTKSDSGATEDTGYFFIENIKQFQEKEALIAALKIIALGEKDRLQSVNAEPLASR